MNQILITENDNLNKKPKSKSKNKVKKSSGSTDIAKILRVFAVLIFVYGLALSGSGAYAIMQSIEQAEANITPEVTMQRTGNNVIIYIKSQNGIRTISYAWNESLEKVIQGKNQTEAEVEVTVPIGESKLNISVIDSQGTKYKFIKNFIQLEDDTTSPQIEFAAIDSGVKIIATDDTALDYIIYKYGDEEEVRIDAEQDNQTTIEVTVPVTQGQASLTVEAVDKSQNSVTEEQEIKGVKKPIVTVTLDENDPSYIVIKATDEEGIRMVSYYVNGQEYKTDPNISLNITKFEWRQRLDSGENTITVHVYNVNELVTEYVGTFNN